MSLYVMADLHLSMADPDKSMEVFGRRWCDYTNKIKKNWNAVVEPGDTVVVPGDISWALTLNDAEKDFEFLNLLPGRKILGKGNHDFWWTTMAKTEKFLAAHGFSGIDFLYNNAFHVENFILCGSRGWFADPGAEKIPKDTDYEKMTAREAARLRLSLETGLALKKNAPDAEMLVFLHFPPVYNGLTVPAITDVLHEFGIRRVYFGHVHGNYTLPRSFTADGIRYALIAADFLNFCPAPVLPESGY